MYINEELQKVLESIIAIKKPWIIDVKLLPLMKGKKVLSIAKPTSSAAKKMVDCVKLKVVGPLSLWKGPNSLEHHEEKEKQTEITNYNCRSHEKTRKTIVWQIGEILHH